MYNNIEGDIDTQCSKEADLFDEKYVKERILSKKQCNNETMYRVTLELVKMGGV